MGGHPVSHHGNLVPPSHVTNIQHSQQRVTQVMKHSERVAKVVDRETKLYKTTYRPVVVREGKEYHGFWQHERPFFSHNWWGNHFYGFYWDVVPVVDINLYFWDPTIFWFYCDQWDDGIYDTWYGPVYDQQPGLHAPFARTGVFYPTQAFRDLLQGVSSWTPELQLAFRAGIADIVTRMETQLSNLVNASIRLERDQVVVTHYQLADSAVVLDGFIALGGQQYAFKALVDLKDIGRDQVFITGSSVAPTQDQLTDLNLLNQRVVDAGGVIEDPASKQDELELASPEARAQPEQTAPAPALLEQVDPAAVTPESAISI